MGPRMRITHGLDQSTPSRCPPPNLPPLSADALFCARRSSQATPHPGTPVLAASLGSHTLRARSCARSAVESASRTAAPAPERQRSRPSSPSPGRQSVPDRASSPTPQRLARPGTPPPGAKVGQALSALLTLAAASPGSATQLRPDVTRDMPAVRFEREIFAPLPLDFIFPYFERFSFYDHHGSFREAWSEPACSVGDRPTDVEPSEGKYHFVMDVHDFLSVYPFPIGMQISSVTCTFITFAQNARWKEFVVDGSMLRTAEEFLFMLYIGSRAAGETSPGVLRHIIGPPSYTVNTLDHGDPADKNTVRQKNFDMYLRGLPIVEPSHAVPLALQRPRASHPDPQIQMMLRSSFPPAFARAHVRIWSAPPYDVPDDERPAAVVAPGYPAHREVMLCRYWAFAAQFAPTVSASALNSDIRGRLLLAVPMGYTGSSVVALSPRDGACFGIPYEPGVPLLEQIQVFTRFLPCDVTPQQMSQTRDARADIIFALPYASKVHDALRSADDWADVSRSFKAAWCAPDALVGPQLLYTALAFERCKSYVQPVPWLSGRIGVHDGPRPVRAQRAAYAFRSRHSSKAAAKEWEDFLALEQERRHLFRAAYEAADAGTGILSPFLENITTAFDLADQLTPPPQGLPDVHADVLLLLPYPEPPAPLHTSYLARMPPQAAPAGFPESFTWDDICRRWGRRIFADCLNMTMAHDCECVRHGGSNLPRHPFICLGPGVFKHFHFLDGGKVRLNQFIFSHSADGRLRLLDFAAFTGDHKNLEAIVGIMGFSTDKELLSFLIHGMRWKVEAPRHFRIGHNLFSLKSRAKGVGEATAKLVAKGLFEAELVCEEGHPLTEDSPCPVWTSPQYSMGMGGADKKDKPLEKRPTGNVSEPHIEGTRERNAPHGEPDGDIVVSFNDLTGKKQPKNGPRVPSSFPDREQKYRVREIYHANAYIRSLAYINGTCPGVSRDDVRWMFFQIFVEPCEYWLQVQYLVIAFCKSCHRFDILCTCADKAGRVVVLCLWRIRPKVINMGTRPSSKVAVRFSKQLNVEWRERMADFVSTDWLPRQSAALRAALADRERRLGYEQAHPFWCCEWTDDFWDLACEPELSAHGAKTRRTLTSQINLWMSDKASCGTIGDYIGARSSLTGGFGTITIEKRTRCVSDCVAALSDLATKDELHAHNSFIVHVVDVLDLEPSVTDGLWAPDMLPVPGFAVIALSDEKCVPHMRKPFACVRARYAEIISLVSTRPAAAFTSGVRDVPDWHAPGRNPAPIFLRMGSDCRASPRAMRIFGHAAEFEWFIALDQLDERWLERHVNVGESTGACVNVATFGSMFSSFQLLQEGDNTTEVAMLLGTSKVPDQQYIRRRVAETQGFKDCELSLWAEHAFGDSLGFDDAGSREYSDVLAGLSAAFGRRRVAINVLTQVPGVLEMLNDILENTTPYRKRPKAGRKRTVSFAPSQSDLRPSLPEERGEGSCASAFCTSASHVLSPTPPRRLPEPADASHDGRRLSPSPGAIALTPCARPQGPAPERGPSPIRACRLSPTPPRPGSAEAVASRAVRSPQPLSAPAARASAVSQAADKLLDPSNPYLLGSGAPTSARALVLAGKECALAGIPRGTLSHDSWGFNWAQRFSLAHDTPVMRPRLGSPLIDADAEAELLALMIFWIAPRMQPAPRKLAKGIGNAQPPSALQAIYGYRRVLRDCGRYLADLKKVGDVLRGLNAAFLKLWGQEALAVDHHIPFSLDVVHRMHEALRSYAIVSFSVALHDAICVIMLFSLVRGPRLDEWCRMFKDDTFYRRLNFVWVDGRVIVGSTQAAAARGGPLDGWLLRVQNVPSKTDRTGQRWMGKFMWYVLHVSSPLNFAKQWLAWELAYPCPENLRHAWPAFSPAAVLPR